MAGETTSTNMGMPIPGVGSTAAPTWASDLNASLNIIDTHDHTVGKGVAITPSGININADLAYNGNSFNTLKKAAFTSQSAAITGTNFLTFVSGNLYVNDGSGNQIPITSAGGVAGSPGSIGSLASPAAATYSAGSKLFTWTADTNKSAAMDNGAVTIRETNVASAKGVTLASPSSLAADYQITLPTALPASTQALNISSSGNTGTISYASLLTSAVGLVTTWTPTLASGGGGSITTSTINYASYWKVGNLIFYILDITLDTLTAPITALTISMPVSPIIDTGLIVGNGLNASPTLQQLVAYSISTTQIQAFRVDAGTLTSGSEQQLQGFYPIA